MGTPLLDRINPPKPTPIAERMSPFMRRLRDKQLPVKDTTTLVDGAWTPIESGRSA